MKILVFTRFNKEGENFKRGLADYLFALQAGNAFHLTIPNRVMTFPIKRKDAVQTDIQE